MDDRLIELVNTILRRRRPSNPRPLFPLSGKTIYMGFLHTRNNGGTFSLKDEAHKWDEWSVESQCSEYCTPTLETLMG